MTAVALEQQFSNLALVADTQQADQSSAEATDPTQHVSQSSIIGDIIVQQAQDNNTGPHSQHVIAGGGAALEALRELIGWPSLYGAEAAALGITWPRGLLLHGPPGCGKTLMVQAVADEFGAVLHTVTAGDVYGAYVGQSERRLREAFATAAKDVAAGKTAVVFLDEVDALCPRRDGTRAHESRVVAQLLTLLDGASSGVVLAGDAQSTSTRPGMPALPRIVTAANAGTAESEHRLQSSDQAKISKGHLVVVGATNRPGALDPALRRPGRLDREVAVSVPDTAQRKAILEVHTSGLQLSPDLNLNDVTTACHGYSGADLAALAREAALLALANAAEAYLAIATTSTSGTASDGQPAGNAGDSPCQVIVMAEHFTEGMKRVGPSIVRGAEVEVPKTSWDDIGGLPDVKKRLRQAVEWPLQHRPAFERLGLQPPRGVLLYGPPGCSKTSLARAAASTSGATLIPLSCAQLFSMYVGEGEALLRDMFRKARLAAPAILLLDEVDALAARRQEGNDGGGGSEAGVRLLTCLLTEMDGVEESRGVLVVGTTNRPQAVDDALMRPGRFDTLLYVPPPDEAGRAQVLQLHTRSMPLDEDVDLADLAKQTAGFSGAEIAGLCREAALGALREDFEGAQVVCARHFAAAKAASRAPAISPFTLSAYENWARSRRGRGAAK